MSLLVFSSGLIGKPGTQCPSWLLGVKSAPAIFQSFNPRFTEPVIIVTFGDSTTAPRGTLNIFAKQLEQRLAEAGRPVLIVNAGIPGDDSQDARQRLDRDVISRRPTVVTILFGINDPQ